MLSLFFLAWLWHHINVKRILGQGNLERYDRRKAKHQDKESVLRRNRRDNQVNCPLIPREFHQFNLPTPCGFESGLFYDYLHFLYTLDISEVWVKLSNTFRTDSMTEFCLGTIPDIGFNLSPISLVITYLFAGSADGQ